MSIKLIPITYIDTVFYEWVKKSLALGIILALYITFDIIYME